jgi:hypothetical protein
MPNSDTMIAFEDLVEGFRFQSENRSVVWQLQAMTGNAKQTSGNSTFHGITALDKNNCQGKQANGRLVNY